MDGLSVMSGQKEGSSRWLQQVERIAELRDSWVESIARRGIEQSLISIEIDPDREPAATTHWNWWITFLLPGSSIDAIAPQSLDHLLFEDSQGRFEDEVSLSDVARYVVDRATS